MLLVAPLDLIGPESALSEVVKNCAFHSIYGLQGAKRTLQDQGKACPSYRTRYTHACSALKDFCRIIVVEGLESEDVTRVSRHSTYPRTYSLLVTSLHAVTEHVDGLRYTASPEVPLTVLTRGRLASRSPKASGQPVCYFRPSPGRFLDIDHRASIHGTTSQRLSVSRQLVRYETVSGRLKTCPIQEFWSLVET